MLRVDHNGGFFSCCTVRLEKILEYFRNTRATPIRVDSSKQFRMYKINRRKDITPEFFKGDAVMQITYTEPVHTTNSSSEQQFSDYRELNFATVMPFIQKYFSPSEEIIEKIQYLERKYNINCENTCGIMYRGNDKQIETTPPSYEEVIERALATKRKYPDMRFLIQTDEKEFLDKCLMDIPDAFHIEETPKLNKSNTSVQYVTPAKNLFVATQYYVAAIHVLSRCKKLITTSGNGELWIMLYRGNAEGTQQYLRRNEYIYGVKNDAYDPNQVDFWFGTE